MVWKAANGRQPNNLASQQVVADLRDFFIEYIFQPPIGPQAKAEDLLGSSSISILNIAWSMGNVDL